MHARKPVVADLDLDEELALLFSESGELLWWSRAWFPPESPVRNPAEPLGKRWEEFVHPDDLDGFRFWLFDAERDLYCFRFLHMAAVAMMRMWIVKLRCGSNWLCLGSLAPFEPDYAIGPEVSGHMLLAENAP